MNDHKLDAYAPPRIAELVESVGVKKAQLPALQTVVLGMLAGAFIAFGAMLFTLVMTDPGSLGVGLHRWVGGIAFSLGLVLVVVAGAELFTGNNLIVMAWVSGRITASDLLRNWLLVFLSNFAGALGCVVLMAATGLLSSSLAEVGATAQTIAEAKLALPAEQAFARGILCNVLVCLAVWMSVASRRISGKVLAVVFPVSAFVALGFEHSIANMYLIPVGMLLEYGHIDWVALFSNLLPVTAGNIIGGAGFVAAVYWVIYLRGSGDEV